MKINFEIEKEEELDWLRNFFVNGVLPEEGKRAMTNAERCKKYRESKKAVSECVESMSECVDDTEEKEKKEKESTKEKEIKEKEEINICISPDTKKVSKKPYGSGANVMLTEEQYWKLCDKFGVIDANNKIEKASMYFASKGKAKEYKDHYMTILNWDRMDRERKMNRRKSWTEIADQLSQETDDLPQL